MASNFEVSEGFDLRGNRADYQAEAGFKESYAISRRRRFHRNAASLSIRCTRSAYGLRRGLNGREAWNKLAAAGADMVITDWNMPEMSGIDFIRAIRANPATKDLPVLMVTTNAAKDDIVEALKAGINGYVETVHAGRHQAENRGDAPQ
jgi:response regulator RpfG family c-di-GMP phosphodiesterase